MLQRCRVAHHFHKPGVRLAAQQGFLPRLFGSAQRAVLAVRRIGSAPVESIQDGEKGVQNFRLETRNPGGHSSIPVRDNAIYELAAALVKLQAYDFKLELSDTTRAFFAKAGAARSDALGKAMQAIAANPTAILLDVRMPDIDGWAVFRTLRADPRFRLTPILVHTMELQ